MPICSDRPTVRLVDGRRAEIIRYDGENRYHAVIRQCGRGERLPVAKLTIRRNGEQWEIVRQHAAG
jgi:mRNA degradation ribonuclease J1/J2